MRIALPCVWFMVLASCSCQRQEPESELTPASLVMRKEGAISELATASCDYQELCGGIDARGKFANREQCMNAMRSDAANELRNCSDSEVSPHDVRRCLFEIRKVECDKPLDRFEERRACRGESLCD